MQKEKESSKSLKSRIMLLGYFYLSLRFSPVLGGKLPTCVGRRSRLRVRMSGNTMELSPNEDYFRQHSSIVEDNLLKAVSH